ncbi:MAG: cache domain-containing protein, partial [Actinomycetota bacterium]|nr:cache domain-containing protein [Actinomycetota bacterium]
MSDGILRGAAAELRALIGTLERVGGRAAGVLEVGGSERESSVRDRLEHINSELIRALSAHSRAACGLGLVLAPGLVDGCARWLQWYWKSPGRPPTRLRANLDPNDPDFYDYTLAPWYRRPFDTDEPAITGPYVDFICSNEYVFTLAVPISARGRYVGIAGADVRAAHIERLLTPALSAAPMPTVVASREGRIIASNLATG